MSKGVIAYDKEGNVIGEYESYNIAGKELGVYSSSISLVCSGKLKKTGGLYFKNKEND